MNNLARWKGKRRRWDVLASIVKENGFTFYAEIGINQGANLRQLLSKCPDLRAVAVDDWRLGYLGWDRRKRDFSRRKFAGVNKKFKDRIYLYEMSSEAAAGLIPDNALDMVFIDADHSYDGVLADIALWGPKVRQGGVVSGHDYRHPDFPDVSRT